MELKELSRRISRYRANVENLQLEKNRLLNEIDALDQEALKIKEYKWQAQNRFKCRVDNIAGMDRYSSRNITNLKGRLKSIKRRKIVCSQCDECYRFNAERCRECNQEQK